MKKIILIDGNSILFKGYYATAYSGNIMQTRSGKKTNALLSFAMMINKIIQDETFSHILVLFDTNKPTFRKDISSEYKANRKDAPEDLVEQFPYVYEFLDSAGIKRESLEGYEADDLIGSYAKKYQEKGYDVIIFSGDTDLLQMVDKNISVNILKKGTNYESYNISLLKENYGFTPRQFLEHLALIGDPSDNIKGITGIGNKTGTKLLQEYKSIDNIYKNIDNIKGKIKENLINEKNDLYNIYLPLATIKCDIPITFRDSELTFNGYGNKIDSFCKKYELFSFLNNIKDKKEEPRKKSEYKVINNDNDFSKLDLEKSALYLEIDRENYHLGKLIGAAIATKDNSYFIESNYFLKSDIVKDYLLNNQKIVFDLKKNIVFLNRYNIVIKNVKNDIMLANYLIDIDTGQYELSKIGDLYGIYGMLSDSDIYKTDKKKFNKERPYPIPIRTIYEDHIVKKAEAISKLNPILLKKLEDNKILDLLYNMELPLSYVLAKLEIEGIKVDINILNNFIKEYEYEINKITDEIYKMAGEKFNISSPKQLGEILYQKLGLTPPIGAKTKTGYSTREEILELLEKENEIISYILRYRHLTKILRTYLIGIKEVIHKDGKVHTIYNQTLTKTGRLSSILPNMQNIPITGKGREIRKMFTTGSNNLSFVSLDYSQIELRILAHLANSKRLKEDFKNNRDIHSETAREIFHNPPVITSQMRNAAKAVNFGIIYGLSAYGLSKDLKVPIGVAENYLKKHRETYPCVNKYMNDIISFAKEKGYVETLFKRRRYLRNITDKNRKIREASERLALNTPIQGLAADIIKLAMIRIDDYLVKNNYKTKMVLQIHDELVFLMPDSEIKELVPKIKEIMTDVNKLDVNLKAEKQIGKDLLFNA